MYKWTPNLVLVKDPEEELDYVFDWSDALETGETISTSNFATDLTSTDTNTATTATVTVSGGTLKKQYRIENTITTSQSRTYVRSFFLRIEKL